MDLIKIGKYISTKRKALGLTQKQLAEKLNMSDKSVSKWERGICLPDFSVYMQLCSILGISLNEFIAGEDIQEDNMIQKSEENIISVTRDGNKRQHHLKHAIILLVCLCLLALCFSVFLYTRYHQTDNSIRLLDESSTEVQTAEMVTGEDVLLFKYDTSGHTSMDFYVTAYHSGTMISHQLFTTLNLNKTHVEGEITILPRHANDAIKVIIADNASTASFEVPVNTDNHSREYLARTSSAIAKPLTIKPKTEQGLAAIEYGTDTVTATPINALQNGAPGTINGI